MCLSIWICIYDICIFVYDDGLKALLAKRCSKNGLVFDHNDHIVFSWCTIVGWKTRDEDSKNLVMTGLVHYPLVDQHSYGTSPF